MMVDWKNVVIAVSIVILGCVFVLAPQLSKGSGGELPACRTLEDDGRIEIGDSHVTIDDRSPPREIVKLPAMTTGEVEQLLASQKLCRMALNDLPQPYIIALDYVYLDGKVYFHFADYGRKMDLISRNPQVSVQIDNFCAGAPDFDTITLMGELEKVTDQEEKGIVAKALISSVNERGGERNVAARHGLKSLDVNSLTSQPSAIYRLDVSDYIALRSPG